MTQNVLMQEQGQGKFDEKNTTNSSNETISATNNVYVYGVGIIGAFAIGVCVFFAYNTFQPKNKTLINENNDQPPKQRHKL